MKRDDDLIILSEEQLILLAVLKLGPVFDFELAKRFGDDFSSMLRDIRNNDHPIHSTGASSRSHPSARIYYYERPGSELALCTKCKAKRRSIGLFCSIDCQHAWERSRLRELVKKDRVSEAERNRRSAKIPGRRSPPKVAKNIRERHIRGILSANAESSETSRMDTHAVSAMNTNRLSRAIYPHIIYHIARKASIRGSISKPQIATMIKVSEQLYNGKHVLESDMRELDAVLAKCLDTGIVEGECYERNCGICRQLERDIDHLLTLRNRMKDTRRETACSSGNKMGDPEKTTVMPIGGSSLFPALQVLRGSTEEGRRKAQ